MRRHAPGPWTMEDGDFEQPFYIMANEAPPGSRMVCALSASDGLTQAANARLIEAAPELLEATQRALDWLNDQTIEDSDRWINSVRLGLIRAIEHATGGEA